MWNSCPVLFIKLEVSTIPLTLHVTYFRFLACSNAAVNLWLPSIQYLKSISYRHRLENDIKMCGRSWRFDEILSPATSETRWDSKLSRRWRCHCRSSVLWRRAVLYVSVELIASIFRVKRVQHIIVFAHSFAEEVERCCYCTECFIKPLSG